MKKNHTRAAIHSNNRENPHRISPVKMRPALDLIRDDEEIKISKTITDLHEILKMNKASRPRIRNSQPIPVLKSFKNLLRIYPCFYSEIF